MCVPLFLAILISSVAAQSGHPEFDPPFEEIVLQEGSLQNIECVAKGELPLVYKWYNQSDAEVTSDANRDPFTRPSENGFSLIFAEVKRSHAGLYSCSATNKYGTASKPYDITVNTTSGKVRISLCLLTSGAGQII
ncbi:hypothetical protein AVEN_225707-1 [Araneus ventricosus]|uniref:Ig-like domain-containing protein n=1 Tax=Araneus ventricosus TaxID=182803 RepID=A0A4Y2FTA9_ARAVE|nr:hypothetical protein AVEN_225707-1 [Araneus ventricosus]